MKTPLYMRYINESKMTDEEFIEAFGEEINAAVEDLVYGNPGSGVYAGVSWNYSPYGHGFYFDGSQFDNFYDLHYWYDRFEEHRERIHRIAEPMAINYQGDTEGDTGDDIPNPSDYYYSLEDAIKDGII